MKYCETSSTHCRGNESVMSCDSFEGFWDPQDQRALRTNPSQTSFSPIEDELGLTHVCVVPGHASGIETTLLVAHPVIDRRKVGDASVVVILSSEQRATKVRRVRICERVIVGVPPIPSRQSGTMELWEGKGIVPSETEIKSADAGRDVVDDADLLMMRPCHCDVASALQTIQTGQRPSLSICPRTPRLQYRLLLRETG